MGANIIIKNQILCYQYGTSAHCTILVTQNLIVIYSTVTQQYKLKAHQHSIIICYNYTHS